MFKNQRYWIGGAGIGAGLLILLIGLLWGLIARLLQLNRQQAQATGSSAAAADGHSGQMTVQPTADQPDAGELSPEMLAAVMVAVRMHRRIRRKQAAPAMRTHQPGTLPSRWIGAGRAIQNLSWHPRHR